MIRQKKPPNSACNLSQIFSQFVSFESSIFGVALFGVFSWEPALGLANSRDEDDDDDDEVQKKALQFSAINSDF